jgi:hypothetical protein
MLAIKCALESLVAQSLMQAMLVGYLQGCKNTD